MHKFFLCVIFFLNISFCNFDKNDAFYYSIKNLEFQNSAFSFKLTKSKLNSFDYTFCWVPTKQILINLDSKYATEIQDKLSTLRLQAQIPPSKIKSTEEQIKKGAPATFEVPLTFDNSNFFG